MQKRILSALCMTALLLSASACSENSSSVSESSQSDTGSAAVSASDSSAAQDDSSRSGHFAPTMAVGEKLKAVYDIYQKGKYTLECKLTGTEIKDEIEVIRVVDGDDVYQLQNEPLGCHGTVTLSGKTYDFDFVCGMYRENPSPPRLNIIQTIVESGVPKTEKLSSDTDTEYDVEQYTYTGDTYITVMDFCFDRQDGHLVKYTMTYSVEGKDDVVEEREITRLDNEIDSSVFNAYFADTLVNFDTMSEEQRMGFCQGLCASYGITQEAMSEMGITTDKLGTIDYDTLFTLIHTYGRSRTSPVSDKDESSRPESSAAETESEPAESIEESSQTDSSDSTLPEQ